MSNISPTFQEVFVALARYEQNHTSSLYRKHRNALQEIHRRLRHLDNQFGRLMDLNARLMQNDNSSASFDPATGTITFAIGEIMLSQKLNPADPNVPVKLVQSVSVSAYQAGAEIPPSRAAGEPLRLQMEELVENYYHGAHRILKLVQQLPALKNFECREITIVRNKLLEHPNGTESYSFGYGTSGPMVRPIHTSGREWIDAGLLPNTHNFIYSLLNALLKAAPL